MSNKWRLLLLQSNGQKGVAHNALFTQKKKFIGVCVGMMPIIEVFQVESKLILKKKEIMTAQREGGNLLIL